MNNIKSIKDMNEGDVVFTGNGSYLWMYKQGKLAYCYVNPDERGHGENSFVNTFETRGQHQHWLDGTDVGVSENGKRQMIFSHCAWLGYANSAYEADLVVEQWIKDTDQAWREIITNEILDSSAWNPVEVE